MASRPGVPETLASFAGGMKGSTATLVVTLVLSCGLFSGAEGNVLQDLVWGSTAESGTLTCGHAGSLACFSSTLLLLAAIQ